MTQSSGESGLLPSSMDNVTCHSRAPGDILFLAVLSCLLEDSKWLRNMFPKEKKKKKKMRRERKYKEEEERNTIFGRTRGVLGDG